MVIDFKRLIRLCIKAKGKGFGLIGIF